jgi:mono/diheme cytochrome c family protein
MRVPDRSAGATCVVATAFFILAVSVSGRTAGNRVLQAPTSGTTVWDGVYSEEQHRRGRELARASCVTCHGDGLTGTETGPPLAGSDFVSAWSGRTAGELFEKIHTTMPADAVGSLKPEQAADLVAHIFKLNDFPAGTTELGSDLAVLKEIRIRSRK